MKLEVLCHLDAAVGIYVPLGPSKRKSQPIRISLYPECTLHIRMPVCLQSYFSVKKQAMAGEGQLRDLRPWCFRVAHTALVLIAGERGTTFIIEKARVR